MALQENYFTSFESDSFNAPIQPKKSDPTPKIMMMILKKLISIQPKCMILVATPEQR